MSQANQKPQELVLVAALEPVPETESSSLASAASTFAYLAASGEQSVEMLQLGPMRAELHDSSLDLGTIYLQLCQ